MSCLLMRLTGAVREAHPKYHLSVRVSSQLPEGKLPDPTSNAWIDACTLRTVCIHLAFF
jgi:hypothetical protein